MKTDRIIAFIALVTLLMAACLPVIACEACKKQQPKILQGITHGAGPNSNWDYLIVGVMVVITLYSLYATIRCMAKSTDNKHQEIKNIVLN